MKTSPAVVKAWSRDWWIIWYRSVAMGKPAHGMVALARLGRGWAISAADLPSDDDRAAASPVPVLSGAFTRWERWLAATYGVRLPKPDHAAVAFLPGPTPDDGQDAAREAS